MHVVDVERTGHSQLGHAPQRRETQNDGEDRRRGAIVIGRGCNYRSWRRSGSRSCLGRPRGLQLLRRRAQQRSFTPHPAHVAATRGAHLGEECCGNSKRSGFVLDALCARRRLHRIPRAGGGVGRRSSCSCARTGRLRLYRRQRRLMPLAGVDQLSRAGDHDDAENESDEPNSEAVVSKLQEGVEGNLKRRHGPPDFTRFFFPRTSTHLLGLRELGVVNGRPNGTCNEQDQPLSLVSDVRHVPTGLTREAVGAQEQGGNLAAVLGRVEGLRSRARQCEGCDEAATQGVLRLRPQRVISPADT